MSSLLLLKIICWQTLSFYQINYYVGFFLYDHFEEKIDEIWVLPINSIISRHNDVKLRHNDVKLRHCASQVAVLWDGFEVVDGAEANINAVWIGLKAFENSNPSLGFQNCWYHIAMSPRVGWNRKGLETIYNMCVGPAMFLVLVLILHTCET